MFPGFRGINQYFPILAGPNRSMPFTDGETAFDKMSITLDSLKPGDKLISKVMRAGRVIELSTTITGR